MENCFYECKIRFDKLQENGSLKRVTESYGVLAVSFTEAESIIAAYSLNEGFEDVEIKSIRPLQVEGCIEGDGNMYYLTSIKFIVINEKTGEKKSASTKWLVCSPDLDSVPAAVRSYYKKSTQDYVIASVRKSPILKIIKR